MRRADYRPWLGSGILVGAILVNFSACRSMGKGNKLLFPPAPASLMGGAQLASGSSLNAMPHAASPAYESAPGMVCEGGMCRIANEPMASDSTEARYDDDQLAGPGPVSLVNHEQYGMPDGEGELPMASSVDQAFHWEDSTAQPNQSYAHDLDARGQTEQQGGDQPVLELPALALSRMPGNTSDISNTPISTMPVAMATAPAATAPVATAPMVTPNGQNSYGVRVYVQGVRPGRGAVKIALFTDPRTFPTPQYAIASRSLADGEPQLVADFQPPSTVAVAVFQDLDSNGSLTRGRAGVPVEPCAFSNDAAIRRGPPSFGEAAVSPPANGAVGEPMSIVVKLP